MSRFDLAEGCSGVFHGSICGYYDPPVEPADCIYVVGKHLDRETLQFIAQAFCSTVFTTPDINKAQLLCQSREPMLIIVQKGMFQNRQQEESWRRKIYQKTRRHTQVVFMVHNVI